ncbi:MAG: DUF3299 domain-containing protein [Cryomorphaceae bacterium]|nr:DUF3299 domain-containing protein [Cryomorphaceae bacterium]
MMKFVMTLTLTGFFLLSGQAQKEGGTVITWKMLADVKFTEKYVEKYQDWFLFPNFGASVKSLEGQKVAIKGYVIPIDLDEGIYALSAYPWAACFFCGGAGPESVMMLDMIKLKRKYNTDDVVTFKGVLRLNSTDIEQFNYILEEAEEVQFHF